MVLDGFAGVPGGFSIEFKCAIFQAMKFKTVTSTSKRIGQIDGGGCSLSFVNRILTQKKDGVRSMIRILLSMVLAASVFSLTGCGDGGPTKATGKPVPADYEQQQKEAQQKAQEAAKGMIDELLFSF